MGHSAELEYIALQNAQFQIIMWVGILTRLPGLLPNHSFWVTRQWLLHLSPRHTRDSCSGFGPLHQPLLIWGVKEWWRDTVCVCRWCSAIQVGENRPISILKKLHLKTTNTKINIRYFQNTLKCPFSYMWRQKTILKQEASHFIVSYVIKCCFQE